MKLPTPAPHDRDPERPADAEADLEGLIAECLVLYEGRGAAAVDELLLRASPDSADIVRERLDLLGRLGMIGSAPTDEVPESIGAYRIEGVLGRGGMGVVYEALQEKPERRVALKVLRSLPGARARARFEHEAQLLGRIQHPGIATIHEVGTAALGGVTVPYFAMELVRGEPLDAFLTSTGTSGRERVRTAVGLLVQVAEAVHHAHQKGVVHRDLKPANVLVDERGAVRVLDFGVARAVDPDMRLETLRTEAGQLVGTLAYMSPEQSMGDGSQIDSQTDVYSLGVVAYELLSGRLPHAVEGRSVLDVLESIRDREPPHLGELDPLLRGDLETIVAKAMAKEREQRYASAHELADDLRRYLSSEPIRARPATALYQLRMFARRHRALVGGAAGMLVLLVAGLAGTLFGLVRAEDRRLEAEQRYRVANAARAFNGRMYASADPFEQGIRVLDLLDRGTRMLDEFQDEPLEDAAARLLLGEAYTMLGEYARAEELLRAASEGFESELGATDVQTLSARTKLAGLLAAVGRFDESEEAFDELLPIALRAHGEASDVYLDARLSYAGLLQSRGEYAEQVAHCDAILAIADQDRPQRYYALGRRAMGRTFLGDFEGAEEDARAEYDWMLASYGPLHPDTLDAKEVLGETLQKGGRVVEGGTLLEEVMETRHEVLGPDHPRTILATLNAAYRYDVTGDFARAGELLQTAADAARRALPREHPTRRLALGNLTGNLLNRGEAAAAEELLWESLEIETELVGETHFNTIAVINNLATAIQDQGRWDEAEELFVQALELNRESVGDAHLNTIIAAYNLGEFHRKRGDHASADPLLEEAALGVRELLGPHDFRAPWITSTWALNLGLLGRLERADEVIAEARRSAEGLDDPAATLKKIESIEATLASIRARGETASADARAGD